jgi:hypothetical protein
MLQHVKKKKRKIDYPNLQNSWVVDFPVLVELLDERSGPSLIKRRKTGKVLVELLDERSGR